MPLYTFVMYDTITQKNNTIHYESRTLKTVQKDTWFYQIKRFFHHSFRCCYGYDSHLHSKYH